MRRILFLAVGVLSFVAPGSVAAGGCPTDPGGLVDRDTYRIGELIQFFDSYTDFGDPGTVTIHFERPADGAVLDYTATNIADGTWFLDLRLDSSAFLGRWNVRVTVDQTSGIETCTDTVTIRARNAPDTASMMRGSPTSTDDGPLGTLAISVVGLSGALLFLRRHATRPR